MKPACVLFVCSLFVCALATAQTTTHVPQRKSQEEIDTLFARVHTAMPEANLDGAAAAAVIDPGDSWQSPRLQLRVRPFFLQGEPIVIEVAGSQYPRTPAIAVYISISSKKSVSRMQGKCGDYGLGWFPGGISWYDFVPCVIFVPARYEPDGARVIEVFAYLNDDYRQLYDHLITRTVLGRDDNFLPAPIVVNSARLISAPDGSRNWELAGSFPIGQPAQVFLTGDGAVTNFETAISSDGKLLKVPAVDFPPDPFAMPIQFVVRRGQFSAASPPLLVGH